MAKLTIAFVAALILGAAGASSAMVTEASPADATRGTGCLLQDAAGTESFDGTCKFQKVVKENADGTMWVHYQDKGHLPADAVLPKSTIRGTFLLESEDEFAGLYQYVITPSGEYSSKGPY